MLASLSIGGQSNNVSFRAGTIDAQGDVSTSNPGFGIYSDGSQVLAGTMTGGQLIQFLLYTGFVGSSAAALTEMWAEMQRAAGAMERLSELLQARPTIGVKPRC